MSVAAGEILPALEALEVARFQTNPNGEVLGLAGLGAPLQPTIVVSSGAPVDDDDRLRRRRQPRVSSEVDLQ